MAASIFTMNTHLYALLEMAKRHEGVADVCIHSLHGRARYIA